MEHLELESDTEINNNEEIDYLPNLTLIQEEELDAIPETVDKVEAILKMLNIPLSDDAEPDLSHMKDFYIEDNIQQLYETIKEKTQDIGLYKALNTYDLLCFLHPNHNPPF
jgi:hypothetical protein